MQKLKSRDGVLRRSVKSIVASGVATALMVGASIAGFATSAVADEDQSGCSYGQGGPKADALCWIDMSSFGNVTATELADSANADGISKDLTIKLGRYTMTTKATVKAGPDGASGVEAAALPTWGGSVLGSTHSGQGYYLGTKGKPAFYQPAANPDVSKDFAQRDSVTLSNIKVYDNTEKNSSPTATPWSSQMRSPLVRLMKALLGLLTRSSRSIPRQHQLDGKHLALVA